MKTIKLRNFSDKRGDLSENTDPSIMSQAKHFFTIKTKPGYTRGNHYHTHKIEWFYIIKGKGLLITHNINTKYVNKQILKEVDNKMICIKPFFAHAIKNIGKGELIILALVSEVHDKKNPDTYPYTCI